MESLKVSTRTASVDNCKAILITALWLMTFCITSHSKYKHRKKYLDSLDTREKTRIDAIAMDRLQGLPRVVDIYGYCGTTVATEYISGPLLKRVAKNKTPMQKLFLATQITEALDDVHSIDGDQLSITHNDIYEDNILLTPDERPVIFDFNMGFLVMTNGDTNVTCGGNLVKKDISALGGLFFMIATGGKKPWDGIYPKFIKQHKEKGVHEIENSSDPAMQTLVKAFKACFRSGTEIPSARQVVAFLQNKTSTI
jgi:tRNA A-37 threonylcarbamoyl transferase component Bud32